MRLIAGCKTCKRQYDATGHASRSQFHCYCGEIVVVPTPGGELNSAVVRCSSCGAPRLGQDPACKYCRASFTLNEQQLGTICPQCTARIKNDAKYCHTCGVPINPVAAVGVESAHDCPHCPSVAKLTSRQFGQEAFSLCECEKCAGLWLHHETFRFIKDKSYELAVPGITTHQKSETPQVVASELRYRKCPECGAFMARQNFGRKSGVIIDVCRDHGIWFDRDELAQILAWVKLGGLKVAEEQKRQQDERDVWQAKKRERLKALAVDVTPGLGGNRSALPILDLIGVVVEIFSKR